MTSDSDADPAAALAARPRKRSFSIRGHRTSISLEQAFWDALKDAAADERIPLVGLVARIDETRGATNLSSAVRVWILARYRGDASSRHDPKNIAEPG